MPDIEGRIAALPIWSGKVELAPLVGGISNQSFTATDDDGKYVVRITRDFPFHHVFRDREVMSARAAHAAGFADLAHFSRTCRRLLGASPTGLRQHLLWP